MPSLRQRLRSHDLVGHKSLIWNFFSSKVGKVACATVVLILISIILWESPITKARIEQTARFHTGRHDDVVQSHEEDKPNRGRLHLLVPATSSNAELCKLLLSAQVLGYPVPQLINYGDVEDLEDAYKQHLTKVAGILNYLEQLDSLSEEYAEDLVLIVDGYDIWFQLPPDVLIRRYYDINRAADDRTRALYGDALFREHDMRQTVIFGPDKLCWPVDYSRPACWAVPGVPLPDYAFGPETDRTRIELFKPRWLNSGTIMGPAKDMRDMFEATLDAINRNYTTDSDQFYFANVFGEQSFARLQQAPEVLERAKLARIGDELENLEVEAVREEPILPPDRRTEYHIGIDYTSSAFQTVAFYKQFLIFMRPVDAWKQSVEHGTNALDALYRTAHHLQLAADIRESRAPFWALESGESRSQEAAISWSDVELLYNVVTNETPVIIHFTGAFEKQLRKFWWRQLWLQSQARQLWIASQRSAMNAISRHRINGLIWYNAEPPEAGDIAFQGRGGAWSDNGGWFSWSRLCKAYEEEVYEITSDEFRHAPAGSGEKA